MVLAAMVEERKRAEKGLRESEEKFRSVFSDASVGMAIVSLDGHFLASNQEILVSLSDIQNRNSSRRAFNPSLTLKIGRCSRSGCFVR